MKKFLPKLGGHRVYLDDFRLMQDSYIECFGAIAGMFSNNTNSPFIIKGCQRLTGFVTGGIQYYPFSTGYFFFNNEIFFFEGTTGIAWTNSSDYFIKIEETILPPSPVEYKDQTNKDAHYSRTLIIKEFNIADDDFDGINGFYYRNAVMPKMAPYGIVNEWYPSYNGEENDVFDSTGLGIGRMYGYAICNGNYNTPDLRGLFTMMPSVNMKTNFALATPAIPSIVVKNKYGSRFAVFTIQKTNLPNVTIPFSTTSGPAGAHNHDTNIDSSNSSPAPGPKHIEIDDGGKWYNSNSSIPLLRAAPDHTHSVSGNTNALGDSTPISTDNVPPVYAMIKIMKINI